jgi:hypothetical protein
MLISTCCGAETDMTEIGICPECLEHCDFEEEDEDEEEKQKDEQEQNDMDETMLRIAEEKLNNQ